VWWEGLERGFGCSCPSQISALRNLLHSHHMTRVKARGYIPGFCSETGSVLHSNTHVKAVLTVFSLRNPRCWKTLPLLLTESWLQRQNYALCCLCVLSAQICPNHKPLKYFGLFMIFKDILKLTAMSPEVSVSPEHAAHSWCTLGLSLGHPCPAATQHF